MTNDNFLNVIRSIRESEELVVNSFLLEIKDAEKVSVGDYLNAEYDNEATDFPYEPPSYNRASAIWAAEVIYLSAQLILHRETPEFALDKVFPVDNFEKNASNFLSVDLCFRFLPDLLLELRTIDPEDPLIVTLESYLSDWHFSGVRYKSGKIQVDLNFKMENDCFTQLYANRIIENKNFGMMNHKGLKDTVLSSLGMFSSEFWPNLKLLQSSEEE